MPRKKRPDESAPAAHEDPVLPGVNPAADHDTPEESLPFPIVAVGASAGGIEAFSRLLGELPSDTGMAYVLIQHLSPKHESMLPEILGRTTRLPVREARHNTLVEPDHVYVMPPGKTMVISHGLLQLGPRTEIGGQHRPIDHFMRSLAEEHGHKAIAVVLSGTGNDGSLGINETKAAGGITFAQDTTAEQDSMPRSAVATGAVDFVLPPEEIAQELGRIARHPLARDPASPPATEDATFGRVLDMLREATGVDFANYKRNTLQRRIARRVILHKLDGIDAYLEKLKADPAEVHALYDDVLISVTSFFRNPDAYETLKQEVFPKLTEARGRHDQVRVWALGCATGEEAYSLAMAFSEYLEASGRRIPVQVFATDLNGAGIERARTGIYNRGITQDVSADRLRRFFVEIDGQYRISKPIRDMCVFARQNVLADPPFSRIDLIACRNMLIYLQPVLQQKLIPVLHYALRTEGVLWLGSSETIGTHRELFDLVDSRHKIYAKKGGPRMMLEPAVAPRWLGHAVPPSTDPLPPARDLPSDPQREADRMLLARYAPPSVIVNGDLEIVQFRGDTSAYLTPAPGRASLNLLKMLREGLVVAVRGAVHRARRDRVPAKETGLRVKAQGAWREVEVMAVPLKDGGILVTFEEPAKHVAARARQLDAEARQSQESADRALASRAPDEGAEREVYRLQQELSAMRDYVDSVTEQHESANEELQAANEEVQSSNEELQSINEELETSKEELQSSNEELATVNDELQNRNAELSRSNSDFANLLSSAQLAIVMVGADLRVRRFTAAAEKLLNLAAADIGRHVTHLRPSVAIPTLESTLLDVMHNIASSEIDVQDPSGRWYSLRVRPYRTADNTIDGVVMAFVDIDSHKRAELAIRESEARFELLAGNAPVLIWMNDLQGIRYVNQAFEEFVGEPEQDIRGTEIARFVHPDDREAYIGAFSKAFRERASFETSCRLRRADGAFRWMQVAGAPRLLADGRLVGYVGSTLDVTEMKEAQEALLELDRGKNEFLAMLAHELRNPLSGIRNATRLLAQADDAETRAQALAIIDRQGEHMTRMVDDLLDVARITSGRIQLRTEPVDLVSILRQSVDLTAADRGASQQKLSLEAGRGEVWVHGDAMRLGQVFSNLLHNASKFSRRGGTITVTLDAERGAAGARSTAVVRVHDEGVGIEPSMLTRIFELFVQADRPVDPAHGGIGLGLTVARRLVELHGGAIEAASAGPGKGSEFIVRLPMLAASEVPVRRPAAARVARPRVEPRRLLIVDDNPDSAESMRLMYRLAGHEVRTVHEGGEAVEAAAQLGADAVLLDIGLPDIDGYEVARRLRADPRTREVLIIAITGYGREDDVRRSREAGIDDHVVKPVDPDAVLARIARGAMRNSAAGQKSDIPNREDPRS
jgi:two-component system CheB/CheR fusion protein